MKFVLWVLLLTTTTLARGAGKFELLAKYRGLGALVASTVGPGKSVGSERLYLSFLYIENTIDVLAVDPQTGAYEMFPNPVPGESGARGMALGSDGNIYLGTLPHAHLLKLDVKAGKLIDLGRPALSEQYIWAMTAGPDGQLYGATYPQARLVRYDPASGKLEDLGRMDDREEYAHFVAANGDFVYVGIGTSRQDIVAYKISTGEHRSIIPAELRVVGQGRVFPGKDGEIYGVAGGKTFRLEGWKTYAVDAADTARSLRNVLKDGREIVLEDGVLTVGGTSVPFHYEGNTLPLFRVGFGPDGELYGSSVLPIQLVKLNRERHALTELGGLGGGEIYTFLAHDKRLLMAAYAGLGSLMSFDTGRSFDLAAKNPRTFPFDGSDHGWRPQAMIEGRDGDVYVGAVSGYGKLGGALTVWNPDSGRVEQHPHLIEDQSVITLALWKDKVVGGTTVIGGGGSHATQKEAKLFIWNPRTKRKEFEMVPLPGVGTLDDFITAPNGLVYGIGGGTLIVFDPERRTVKLRTKMPFKGTVYNSVAMGADGRIWGLTAHGIFAIDLETNEGAMVAESPERITGGFALRDRSIYFVSGASLYRYDLEQRD